MTSKLSPLAADFVTAAFALSIFIASSGVLLLGGAAFVSEGELIYTSNYLSTASDDSLTFLIPAIMFGCYLVFFSWLPHRRYLLKFIMFFLFWLLQLPNWIMEMASYRDMIITGGNWPVAVLIGVYTASSIVIPAVWIIQVRTHKRCKLERKNENS